MSQETGIKQEDIISTLQSLDMIRCWKGQHVIYVRQDVLDEYMSRKKELLLCHPEYLTWQPQWKKEKGN
eukprot:CAMPEP_0202459816 /NCGR_PEP_ID=MMETSP1360-20130828/39131_1 /ASSEMBLY_ACC=CAM_ASM_000848 /TAXON_ID=515479 /ORGANISM="Licmophora paradoxa, Strain CCMP2313" /LENGTH=68 /DNA_ID=CAMNT_0049081139 /DNA_START=65 /DNA_END=271 /DNA_ORIENTATION=-